MRFLLMVMLSGETATQYETGYMGEPEDYATMGEFNQAMADAGVMLAGDGLHPTSAGARIDFADAANPVATDGPFAEVKEVLGGYWIIQTNSREEAVEWARKAPMMKGDVLVLRRIMDMDEYTPEQQEAAGFTTES